MEPYQLGLVIQYMNHYVHIASLSISYWQNKGVDTNGEHKTINRNKKNKTQNHALTTVLTTLD